MSATYKNVPFDHLLAKRWRSMMRRCNDPKSGNFHNYGARGIRVDPRFADLETFVAWGIANGFHPSLHLDRVDNDGDYSPDNCRWATRSQNQRNKRTTIRLSDGRSARDVAELSGLPWRTVRNRVRRGMALDDACVVPYGKRPAATAQAVQGESEASALDGGKQAEGIAPPPQRRQNGAGLAQPASDGGRGRESRRAVVAAVPGRCPRGDERNGHA